MKDFILGMGCSIGMFFAYKMVFFKPKASKKTIKSKSKVKANTKATPQYYEGFSSISHGKISVADGVYLGELCGYVGSIQKQGLSFEFQCTDGIRGRANSKIIVKDSIAYLFLQSN